MNQVSLAQPKSLIIAKQLLAKKQAANSLLRSPAASVSYQGTAAAVCHTLYAVCMLYFRTITVCLCVYAFNLLVVLCCICCVDFMGVITANVAGTAGGALPAAVTASTTTSPTAAISSTATTAATSANSAVAASAHNAASCITQSAAAAAVSNRLKDIKGHEYALVVFLAPVVLYYAIGG